jgi:hypothetical protein
MSALYSRLLKRQISKFTEEFMRLEAERDAAIRARHLAVTPEQKRQYTAEIVRAMGDMRRVEQRLHCAKRLLARAEGDEYEFRVA